MGSETSQFLVSDSLRCRENESIAETDVEDVTSENPNYLATLSISDFFFRAAAGRASLAVAAAAAIAYVL